MSRLVSLGRVPGLTEEERNFLRKHGFQEGRRIDEGTFSVVRRKDGRTEEYRGRGPSGFGWKRTR